MLHNMITIIGLVFLLGLGRPTLAMTIDINHESLWRSHITAAPPEPSILPRFNEDLTSIIVYTYTANEKDGGKLGDIVISLPSAVAKSANELLTGNPDLPVDCSDADGDFESKKLKIAGGHKRSDSEIKKRQRLLPFAAAICGAEALIDKAIPGGPLALFSGVNMGEILFKGEGAERGFEIVQRYAESVAGNFGPNPNIDNIARLSWALSAEHHLHRDDIGNVNRIQAIDIIPPGRKCSSTIDKCTANCNILGAEMAACSTKCSKKVTSGFCESTSSASTTKTLILTLSITPFSLRHEPRQTTPPPPPPKPAPVALCPDDDSGLPSIDLARVAESRFCKVADGPRQPQSQSYNAMGEDFHKIEGPFGRPNMINLHLFRLDFQWEPLPDTECSRNCVDAYRILAESHCGKKGGNNFMSLSGSVNVGCGRYSYSIKPAPKFGVRKCFDAFNHPDVSVGELNQALGGVDNLGWRDQKLAPGNPVLNIVPDRNSIFNNLMEFSVNWVPNCESNVQPMSVGEPIPGEFVKDILRDNWKRCDNGGAGGYIDAGCLRYAFKPGKIHDEFRRSIGTPRNIS